MKLVVFDLDGTLTRTSTVDGHCFVQAVADVFGIDVEGTDGSGFEHVTDTGILGGLFSSRFGRPTSAAESARVVGRFMEFLEQRHGIEPAAFSEVPGAASLLASLRGRGALRAAIATERWERPARFKCRVAGLDDHGIPAAFAEDGPSREAIVQTTVRRAARAFVWRRFERIVTVEGATWVVKTARALDLPFVGVGEGKQEKDLRWLGTSHVVSDYRDRTRFLQAVEHATPPSV